jgi:hypothetical protein
MAIPRCNSTTPIQGSESLGTSLYPLNTNFYNLDSGLCELSSFYLQLEAFIKSLSAKDSFTIDKSFSVAGYFLSADVNNLSLGTIKLGVDIPNSAKIFLKDPKITNCIDVQISDPTIEHIIAWNGTKWTSVPLVDEIGARELKEFNDVTFTTPILNTQVLQFKNSNSKWINGPDQGLDNIPDGDYDDINVSGGGKIWNIRPSRVTPFELASSSVTNSKITNSTITNLKFRQGTIQLNRCAFAVGEVNSGVNLGLGAEFFAQKSGTQLQFRTIKPAGSVSFELNNDNLIISAPLPAIPPPPRASNVGNGTSLFKTIVNSNVLQLKTLRAGSSNILIEPTGQNEITISRSQRNVGLSIVGIKSDGTAMSDDDIKARVASVFLPEDFAENTICTVSVEIPTLSLPSSTTVEVPFSLSYKIVQTQSCINITGQICTYGVNFDWVDPSTVEETVERPNGKRVGIDRWSGNKNLRATVSVSGTSRFSLPTPTVKTYRKTGNNWVLIQ